MPRVSRILPVFQGRSPRSAPCFEPVAAIVSMVLLLLALTLPAGGAAQEATPAVSESVAASPLEAASRWLRARQDPAGGFPGFSGELDPGATTDAVLALYAARESDSAAGEALAAAVSYLEANGAAYAATGPGQAAKLALAAVAGGRDPRAFAGVDLVAAMTAPLATPVPGGVAGLLGDDLYDHALILLGLAAASVPVPESAIEALRVSQAENGGWAFDGSTAAANTDSNTTALAIQALSASGYGDDPMVARAIAYLPTLQAPDGGFAYGPADPLLADANSTALVVQALIAAGENPAAREWGNPLLTLARFQLPDGGFRYLATDAESNLLATLQAMPALARAPLPVAVACGDATTAETGECVPLAA
jgi:hypothetical protein